VLVPRACIRVWLLRQLELDGEIDEPLLEPDEIEQWLLDEGLARREHGMLVPPDHGLATGAGLT
jgi:hypothetical protein